jgi:hypothetical protein
MDSSNIVVVNVVVKTKPTLSAIRGDGEEPLGLDRPSAAMGGGVGGVMVIDGFL